MTSAVVRERRIVLLQKCDSTYLVYSILK